jgi:hypothetical protein
MEAIVAPKRQLTLNGLHNFITQVIEPFITTGVRTSNPAAYWLPQYGQYLNDSKIESNELANCKQLLTSVSEPEMIRNT